ncbi:MAG: hypothetical protein QXP18_07715, partial [Sulfolobales archaeon]
IISLSVFLHIKSKRYLDKRSLVTGLIATLGMILHAVFTTVYVLEDLIKIYISDGVEKTLAIMREAEIKAKSSMKEGLRLPVKST